MTRTVFTVAVGVSGAAGLALALVSGPATASSSAGGPPVAVTSLVSMTAQRAALAYWTPARMAAAAGDQSVPQASQGTPASEAPASGPPAGTPTAVAFSGVPTTGALFYTTGSRAHFCTASVTDSQHRDLVLTAAHCVYWTAYVTNLAYVPQYHSGTRPYGTWPVKSITVAAHWRTTHDPNLDIAFLGLAAVGGRAVQSVTGGLSLGLFGAYAMPVVVIGHNNSADQPVRCATRSFEFRPGQREFYCHGFWSGTSGGPWITGLNGRTGTGTVRGLIGGYQQGGDVEWASYSPYFGSQVASLFQRAQQAG